MNDAWFRPKRYGLGAGLPIAWQGWATLIGYVAAAVLLTAMATLPPPAPGRVIVATLGMIAITIAFVWITALKTEGGWRWRWGGRDDDAPR